MKRFQECNWLVKLWRYRFYLPLPFKFIYYKCTSNIGLSNRDFFGLLKGSAQISMEWTYTTDEVMSSVHDRIEKKKNCCV